MPEADGVGAQTPDHPLFAVEPRFRRAIEVGGPLPPLAARPPDFGTLLRIILEQQVSVHTAETMWRRLAACCDPLEPAPFLSLGDDTLQGFGFTRQKRSYARALAAEIIAGRLDLDVLATLPDAAAMEMLVRQRGIGRWSAEVYLMFALNRPDIWPAQDLGLQLGVQAMLDLPARPGPKELDAIAEPWRPHRTMAARLVWHLYLSSRGRRHVG
ncbi:MAG TPA: DNA-3-methyladenine glycosylase 2 family protein [Azospirillaceae bacterium]|nr:DNA-3-methyladenine glycosylase 2 family protein [Azospirillaceae bacterium]